jgi:methionine synthase I (cobalamin-dependent)
MTSETYSALSRRLLGGRPLLLGGDVASSLRLLGADVDGPGALGKLVREQGDKVDAHYSVEVAAGVDLLSTLTSDTTPRALAQVGMAYRSAAITAMAVDRAASAGQRAMRPIAIAGVLGGGSVSPVGVSDLAEDLSEHAARLEAAGCDLILARGDASRSELLAAVVAATHAESPTWAVVAVDADGTVLGDESPVEVVRLLEAAGASALLLDAETVAGARTVIEKVRRGGTSLPLGVLLDADGPDGVLSPDAWAEAALGLLALELRAFGGGRGCTHEHTAALSRALRRAVPSMAPPVLSAVRV